MILKELCALFEAKKKAVEDFSPLAQLKKLAQPIGINGGSYTYWVDVTKTPLKFTASDGSEINEAKTLRDIGKWMEETYDWYAFLDGDEDLDFLLEYGIVRLKKGRTDQGDHEMQESLREAKNYLGDTEYSTYKSWKAAIKKAANGKPVTFTGDIDIDEAHVDGQAIGEWGGDVGSVYKVE